MSYSAVAICNQALIKIGSAQINALTEDSKSARHCNAFYDQARDSTLSIYPWKFARRRKKLARLDYTPDFGYAYAYQLPTDYLTMYRAYGADLSKEGIDHVIEGRELLTDEETVYIIYIRKITDPNLFSALFVEALSSHIAMTLSIPLANSKTLKKEMENDFEKALVTAETVDAHGSTEDDTIDKPDSWLAARA